MLPGRFATNQHPDFEILGEISRGGMGVVLKAKQREIGRICALKLIAIQTSRNDQTPILKRFDMEAQALSRLRHRNIVTLFTYAYESNCPYIVMEHIAGPTLEAQAESLDLEDSAFIDIFTQIADALAYCHEKGIVHRDIKPSNIILSSEAEGRPHPVLVDFGIAKSAKQSVSRTEDGISLTGELVGTPVYMSPEQLDPEEFGEVSAKTDVWGLGVTLYQCLTGVLPFHAPSAVGTLQKIYLEHPPSPITLNGQTPKWLGALVLNCLKKDPTDRPNMSEVAQAFREKTITSADQISFGRRILPFTLLSLLALSLLALFGFLVPRDDESIRLIHFDLPPRITGHAEYRLVGQISQPHIKFSCGSVTGVSDFEGRIAGRVKLPEGKNILSLKVFSEERWIELKSVSIQVDTVKPELNYIPDFANVCVLKKGESTQIIVEDNTAVEWKLTGDWRPLNSNRMIELYADANEIERVIQVKDAAGHSTTLKLKLISENRWNSIKQSLDNLDNWGKLPDKQKEMLAHAIEKGLGVGFRFENLGRFGLNNRNHIIPIYRHERTGMIFHLIPGGQYMMGLSAELALDDVKFGRDSNIAAWKRRQRQKRTEDLPELIRNEMPSHGVVMRAFLLAEHECTEKEWAMLQRNYAVAPGKADFPIANISWSEIKTILKSNGQPLRLPSEAEWEYACRAGTSSRFYWGSDPRKDHAWHHKNSRRGPHAYSDHSNKRNPFGLIDMSGNAAEWCEDSFLPNYNAGPSTGAPRITPSHSLKVVRGGSWHHGLGMARSSRRLGEERDLKAPFLGVRFALSLPKIP